MFIAVISNLSQSYKALPAIWNYIVLSASWSSWLVTVYLYATVIHPS